jgi:hypothetical protein
MCVLRVPDLGTRISMSPIRFGEFVLRREVKLYLSVPSETAMLCAVLCLKRLVPVLYFSLSMRLIPWTRILDSRKVGFKKLLK